MYRTVLLLTAMATAVLTASGQTQLDLHSQSRGVDFRDAAYTRPVKTVTSLPTACQPGDLTLLNTAPAGANLYYCAATDSWVPELGSAAQAVTVQNEGITSGARGTVNFVPGFGVISAVTDLGNKINIQQAADTSRVVSTGALQRGEALLCQSSGGSNTAYECFLNPTLTQYSVGMVLHWRPDVATSEAGATLSVDLLGPIPIRMSDGISTPSQSDILGGRLYSIWFDGSSFRLPPAGGGSGATAVVGLPNRFLATSPTGTAPGAVTLRSLASADIPANIRRRGFQVVFAGQDLVAGSMIYATMPYACTATGFSVSVDPAGTATIRLSKVPDGSTLPGGANDISTNGFALSTGSRIHGTDLSDLTTTSWSAWDTTGIKLAAVSGNPNHVNFTLECVQ